MPDVKKIMIAIAIVAGIYMTGIAFCTQAKAEIVIVPTNEGLYVGDTEYPDCFFNAGTPESADALYHFLNGGLSLDGYMDRMEELVGAPPPKGWVKFFKDALRNKCGRNAI